MTDTRTDDLPGTSDWRADRLGSARRGENPTVLARLGTGWAAIGDTQRLPGYCVLLHDGDADHLTDLPRPLRSRFLDDMGLLGEAIIRACGELDPACRRVNYEILGNSLGHLHAHVFARYDWEEPQLRRGPVWHYGDLYAPAHALGPSHEPLRQALTEALLDLGAAPA